MGIPKNLRHFGIRIQQCSILHQVNANERLLNEILKGEWGFKDMVMSDWILAAHATDTVNHLNNGMDLEMPFADAYTPTAVQTAPAPGRAPRRPRESGS